MLFYFIFLFHLITCNNKNHTNKQPNKNPIIIKDEVTILHTNDIHSHYDETNLYGMDCNDSQRLLGECYGGIARMNTIIKQVKKEENKKNNTVLLMDGGDQFQGTLFFNYYKGKATSEIMNYLNYDLMTIGNHEFDYGPNHLADIISTFNFPVICANIQIDEGPLKEVIQPYYIIEELNLAVIGYISDTTDKISPVGETISFLNAINTVQNIIDYLNQEKGITRFIGLSHYGYDQDQILAKNIRGLSLIVGGHSHTYLGQKRKGVYSRGNYPTKIINKDNQITYIVQAYCWLRFLGKLKLKFNRDNNDNNNIEYLKELNHELIELNNTIEKDIDTQQLVNNLRLPFDKETNIVIGNAKEDFNIGYCQFQECGMGNLITDAMINQLQDNDLAIINSGGIRAYFSKGNITIQNILTVLPFKNQIVSTKVKGQFIYDLIVNSVSRINTQNQLPVTSFIQVANLKLQIQNQKLITLKIFNKITKNYSDINFNQDYKLLSLDFILDGGDNIIPHKINYTNIIEADKLLLNYIKKLQIISPILDQRILNSNSNSNSIRFSRQSPFK